MSSRSLLRLGKLRLQRGYLGFERLDFAFHRRFVALAGVGRHTGKLTFQRFDLLFDALDLAG